MAAVIHHPEFDEYWNEFDDIKSTKVTNGDGEELELPKTPDEGEQEAAWLKEAGYNSLVNKYRAGSHFQVTRQRQDIHHMYHRLMSRTPCQLMTSVCMRLGENIGERRLDPNTIMLALYRVNPNAEWIVRKKREQ
ncbi:hypothetical protein ScPMuIL_009606 [Solemya velum]